MEARSAVENLTVNQQVWRFYFNVITAERDEANDYVRAKLATIRRNVRQFQVRHGAEAPGADVPDDAGRDIGDAPIPSAATNGGAPI